MIEKNIAIGFILHEDRLLILERKDTNPIWDKKWEFPGGKIEDGEEPALAFLREVREETGIIAYDFAWINPKNIDDWDLLEANADVVKKMLWPKLGF